jgi:hypothetical protein
VIHALAGGVVPEDETLACAWCNQGCEVEAPTVSEAISLLTCVSGTSNKEAAAGLHPDDGQTEAPREGTIMNNVTSTLAGATDIQTAPTMEVTDRERADSHATDTLILRNWSPIKWLEPNTSGIWHVILREEAGHPIPEMRAYLEAVPFNCWTKFGTDRVTEVRGHTWGAHLEDEGDPDEFRFTYIDRYEITDTLISTRTGEWTCTFRRIQEGN